MFIKKTADEILNNGLETLVENTPLNNIYAGSIARTILESFSYEMGANTAGINNFYEIASYVLQNGFLSSAADEYLDLIGELLDYPRRQVETYDEVTQMTYEQPLDADTYRYEISRRVHTIATSNEEALRLALLSINGVKEVRGEEYTQGAGSFTFVIVPQDGYSNESIRTQAEDVLQEKKAYGVKYIAQLPIEVKIDIDIQLIMKESSSSSDLVAASASVVHMVERFLGSYDVGETFIYNDFVQEVMNSDAKIMDFKVQGFYMSGEPILLTNQAVAADERIRPGNIQVV